MSWIKIQTTLIDDPAVSAIAARLRMTEAHVVGCLVAVWSWADNLTVDGFVLHATPAQVDRKAGKKGFAEAMEDVGWLGHDPLAVWFPKWDRHNGDSAKARAGEAESKRMSRQGKLRACGLVDVAPSGQGSKKMSGQMSGQNRDECPDQIRLDKIKYNPPIPQNGKSREGGGEAAPSQAAEPNPRIHYPPPLANPQFIAVFEGEWLPYLASNNQRMPSNFTVDSQLRQMASHNNVQTAIDCMQSAIRLGLRAPLKNRPRATPPASQPEPVNAGTIAL